MNEHEWMRDPEHRGEGLVCRNCGVTEAEAEQAGIERCTAAGMLATGEDWL